MAGPRLPFAEWTRPRPVAPGPPLRLPKEPPTRPLGQDPLLDLGDAILAGLGLTDPFPPEASRATTLGGLLGAAVPVLGMAKAVKGAKAAAGLPGAVTKAEAVLRGAIGDALAPVRGATAAEAVTGTGTAAGDALEAVRDTSYRGQHTAPGRQEGAPLHDLTGAGRIYPDDIYSPNAVQYYGTGDPVRDRETNAIIQRMKGRPDVRVPVYRAVPKEAPDQINPGDWVTINKQYAIDHGESSLRGDYKIVSTSAKASDLFTEGNSIHEWGWHPDVISTVKPKPGIRAYHGSPHEFDKFSLEKVGTGEGAQMYGHGLYFAENEAVADEYRKALAGKPTDKQLMLDHEPVYGSGGVYQTTDDQRLKHGLTELHGRSYFKRPGKDSIREMRDELERSVANFKALHAKGETMSGDAREDAWRMAEYEDALYALDKLGDRLDIVPPTRPGHSYEVDLNVDPDTLLDWDKPLSQQSETVQRILKERGLYPRTTSTGAWYDPPGFVAYDALKVPRTTAGNSQAASAALRDAGISGIKYLDQGSRGAGEGTSNYVMFHDAPDVISILRRYGILPPLAAGAAAAGAGTAQAAGRTPAQSPPSARPTMSVDQLIRQYTPRGGPRR